MLNFKIKGLTEALENDDKVVSIFSPKYVKKVFPAIQNFKEGNAIFTFPTVFFFYSKLILEIKIV